MCVGLFVCIGGGLVNVYVLKKKKAMIRCRYTLILENSKTPAIIL